MNFGTPGVTVIVQTCPERREAVEETLESLRQSDAADYFEVMEHPEGMERCRFFRSVLVRMSEVETPYVIRCEDDILVSPHILHNFTTWPALSHPKFGCGWLYVSEMTVHHEATVDLTGTGLLIRNMRTMYGALCVGMPTEHAHLCVGMWDRKAEQYGCPLSLCARGRACRHATAEMPDPHEHGQDTLISQAVWDAGRYVFFHLPAQAENRLIESVRGTTYPPTPELERHLRAGRYFAPGWRRHRVAVKR